MRPIWSIQAYEAYLKICSSIRRNFGSRIEKEYIAAVNFTVKQLTKHPGLGQSEYELAADGSVHSKVINGLSKIIYYTDDSTLYVADVWDTRQDPNMLMNRFAK